MLEDIGPYYLFRVIFKESEQQIEKKKWYEQQAKELNLPDLPVEPDCQYVYAEDEEAAAVKAEKQYHKVVERVELLDTSREQDPNWIEEMFVKGGWKKQ